MTMHTIGDADDFTSGEVRKVKVDGLEIAVCKIDGEFYAISDVCPHQEASFSMVGRKRRGMDKQMGRIDDEKCTIHCPYHYWEFDLKTGESVAGFPTGIGTFEVNVVDNEVKVEI